ncbi:MAG: phenylacetic acid degradation protein PaaY [Thauera sp.]|jgi:phenylacetic acid degradation protein
MTCYAFAGLRPVVSPDAFVHPDAVLIGDVIVGAGCYVAPLACLRGDFGRIVLEPGSNVQDTCVMHGFPGSDSVVEEDGHVGHGAVLHGCRVGRNALIGMNAVIMDGALIGESSIVAACAFVKSGMQVPPQSLVAGLPARVIRALGAEEVDWKRNGTSCYQTLARVSLATLEACEPLTAVEAGRKRIDLFSAVTLQAMRREGES